MSCIIWVVCYELYIRVCIYIRRPAGNAPIHPQGHTRIIRGLYDGSQNSILTKLLTEFLRNCSHNFYQIINTIIDQIINTIVIHVIHTIYYSSQMSCKCILWNFEFIVTTPKCVCIYRLKWTKAKKWMGWDGNLCEILRAPLCGANDVSQNWNVVISRKITERIWFYLLFVFSLEKWLAPQ